MNHDRQASPPISGRNAVLMALRRGSRVREVLVDAGAQTDERLSAIAEAASAAGVTLRRVPRQDLDRRFGPNHQGVVAMASAVAEPRLKEILAGCADRGKHICLLAYRELLHEQNLGAILRTADAAEVDALILPSQGAVTVGSEAVRVSTGASETVPVVRQSLTQALSSLRREGVTVIGAEADGDRDYWEQDMTGPVAFVLGGENRALSPPLREACDAIVRLPMHGHVSSLNVSVASALLLYERLRQARRTE